MTIRAPLRCLLWATALAAALTIGCKQQSPEAPADSHSHHDGHSHDHGSHQDADHEHAGEPGPPFGPQTSVIKPVLDKGWCGGHGVPESVCTRCDDSLIPAFRAAGDWCREHDLPETQCVKCHPEVADRWAELNPAHVEPSGPNAPIAVDQRPALIRVERSGRQTNLGESDPLCPIESSVVRLADSAIRQQAGIEVTRVIQRRLSATIDVPAEVVFDATRVTRVTPRVGGVAREVLAYIGDDVQPGDLLAVVDSVALGEAKSQYIEREQDLRVAQSEHERVRTIYDGAQRLLAVATADIAPTEIQQRLEGVRVGKSRGDLLRAHATLRIARVDAAREAQLHEKRSNSVRDVQVAEAALASAEAEFIAIREQIAFETQRDLLDAERALQVARSALDAASRRLHILGLSPEQIARLASESPDSLSRYELRSPSAGRIVEKNLTRGEAVSADDAPFVLADISTLWLMASVRERDLSTLAAGQPVLFTVDGLPGRSFEGRLSWISSQVDEKTRLLPVRANIDNNAGLLRAHMFGRVRIILRDDASVLSVPVDSIQTDGCCQIAFVETDENVFTPRKVRLGPTSGGYTEVVHGLRENEAVVTTGSFLLKTEILKSNIGAGCCEVDPGR